MSKNAPSSKSLSRRRGHRHGWVLGLLGLGVGIGLLAVFPKLPAIGATVGLVVLFHVVGLAVSLGSLFALGPRLAARLFSRRRTRVATDAGLDFGWSFTAMYGPWVVALAIFGVALGLQIEWPAYWPAWFLLALLGVTFWVGGLLLRTSARVDHASLPLVDLFAGPDDRVLDAGCGGGRTTLAVAKALPRGRIVSLDRFDADYIVDGGRGIIERNLQVARVTDRVTVQSGDMTRMPFDDGAFDTVVSAHAMDHLGDRAPLALAETHRVLRPGGRFLLVVWVPGWVTFSLANVFCLFLPSPTKWRRMAARAGLRLRDAGSFNGLWFAVWERPV